MSDLIGRSGIETTIGNRSLGVEKYLDAIPGRGNFDTTTTRVSLLGNNDFMGPAYLKKADAGNLLLEVTGELVKEEVTARLTKMYGASNKDLSACLSVVSEVEHNPHETKTFPMDSELHESEVDIKANRVRYVVIESAAGKKINLPIVKIGDENFAVDQMGFAYKVTAPDLGIDSENNLSGNPTHLRISTQPAWNLKDGEKIIGTKPKAEKGNLLSNNGIEEITIPSHLEMNAPEHSSWGRYMKSWKEPKVFENKNKNKKFETRVSILEESTISLSGMSGLKGIARKLAPNVAIG